jgi:hypothetical protein
MNKYLVISYDTDQQQWFYDLVAARTPEAAKGLVLEGRPYVVDADAVTGDHLINLANMLHAKRPEQISQEFNALMAEA